MVNKGDEQLGIRTIRFLVSFYTLLEILIGIAEQWR